MLGYLQRRQYNMSTSRNDYNDYNDDHSLQLSLVAPYCDARTRLRISRVALMYLAMHFTSTMDNPYMFKLAQTSFRKLFKNNLREKERRKRRSNSWERRRLHTEDEPIILF